MAGKVLSCFIDESGDFGPYEAHSPNYYVALVLHDQAIDISDNILGLEYRATNEGYPDHAIHTGPLIRRESVYRFDLLEKRKHLFNILFYFAFHLPVNYFCIKVEKKRCNDEIIQAALISKALSECISKRFDYWNQFDKIVIYYDNGQIELTKIITSVFFSWFSNVEMRKVKPAQYKLFQVADMFCTLEMINDKASHNEMTRSEIDFFNGCQRFKKDYYKKIVGKRLL